MIELLMSDLVEPRIDEECRTKRKLKTTYGKIKWRLIEFAESLEITFADLRFFHICSLSGELNMKLTEFLHSARRKKESHRPHSEHKREIWGNVNRVISEVLGRRRDENRLSVAERQAPSWMEPILDLLPRDMPKKVGHKLRREGKHRSYPLTINGEMVLESFLSINEIHEIQSIETLPTDILSKLREEIRNTPRGISPKYIIVTLETLARKLGLTNGKPASTALKFKDWSPKFKQQFENYKSLAVKAVEKNSVLEAMAKLFDMKLYRVKEMTIKQSQSQLEIGLSHCGSLPDNFGVEDLLVLTERKVSLFGIEKIEKYNVFVERYRKREQDRESKYKRAGFDSGSFEQFIRSVVSVAKYNGLFPQLEEFCRAYSVRLDHESRQNRKTEKKAAFTLSDIDAQIAKIEKLFFEIVRRKLFMPHPDRSYNVTEKALKVCLYYPILITLRYTGLRQKNIRNCRIMLDPENYSNPQGNIGLKADGTLVFHYTEAETKNGKKLHAEFNLKQHGETHGTFIRGMTKYLKQVHPFIVSSRPNNVQGQCFVYVPDGELKFQRFPESTEKDFYRIFTSWSHMFFRDFLNAPQRRRLSLNPHFFRGVCCDWLHDVLKFSFDQIGEYIGDTAETVRKEYINRNRVHDATPHVTLKNIELRLSKEEETKRTGLFESIMRRYHDLEQENDKNKDKIKSLEEQIRERDREIEKLKEDKDASESDPNEEEPPSD